MGSQAVIGIRDAAAVASDFVAEKVKRHGSGSAQTGPKPECSSGDRGSYDTPWHVFALFLILTLSTLACAIPLLTTRGSGRHASSSRSATVIFACQHFGTGVLIATAFVHLLPTAFESLTDPCLPDAFNVGYPPLAGLVAMVAALAVVWIEQCLASRGAGHAHAHHNEWDESDVEGDGRPGDEEQGVVSAAAISAGGISPRGPAEGEDTSEEAALMGNTSAPGTDNNPGSLALDELSPSPTSPTTRPRPPPPPPPQTITPEDRHRLVLQCMLLEAGILFHSIFIGMAISVATGPAFIVFLVAISFHQVFEGLALGSRIAALHYPRASPRPWLMVLAYGATTPIGQAIGLAMHNLYDPRSVAGLLMVGFMNAISAGLLLFAGLVQLLAEDFLSEKSYTTLKGKRRRWAFVAVISGAALMALVGAFA